MSKRLRSSIDGAIEMNEPKVQKTRVLPPGPPGPPASPVLQHSEVVLGPPPPISLGDPEAGMYRELEFGSDAESSDMEVTNSELDGNWTTDDDMEIDETSDTDEVMKELNVDKMTIKPKPRKRWGAISGLETLPKGLARKPSGGKKSRKRKTKSKKKTNKRKSKSNKRRSKKRKNKTKKHKNKKR